MACLIHTLQCCNSGSCRSLKWHWNVRVSLIQPKRCVTASVAHVSKSRQFSPTYFGLLCASSRCSAYKCIFAFSFLPRRGSRVEVEDLVWGADEVTTILGNASSNRIHVRTLIGIAKLFHDFNKSVIPTRLLLFGLPWSVACAKIFEELAICKLVHLRQLHGARMGVRWMRLVQRSGGNVGRSMIALRTIDSRIVEMLVQTGLILARSV
jgi:hypothetical protein